MSVRARFLLDSLFVLRTFLSNIWCFETALICVFGLTHPKNNPKSVRTLLPECLPKPCTGIESPDFISNPAPKPYPKMRSQALAPGLFPSFFLKPYIPRACRSRRRRTPLLTSCGASSCPLAASRPCSHSTTGSGCPRPRATRPSLRGYARAAHILLFRDRSRLESSACIFIPSLLRNLTEDWRRKTQGRKCSGAFSV